jgi:hypothetical protein
MLCHNLRPSLSYMSRIMYICLTRLLRNILHSEVVSETKVELSCRPWGACCRGDLQGWCLVRGIDDAHDEVVPIRRIGSSSERKAMANVGVVPNPSDEQHPSGRNRYGHSEEKPDGLTTWLGQCLDQKFKIPKVLHQMLRHLHRGLNIDEIKN